MAQQVIPKSSIGYRVGRRILSLCENIVPLTTNSSFLLLLCNVENPSTRLNLQAKNCLHQSLWRLLRLINWQMNRVRRRLRVVLHEFGSLITSSYSTVDLPEVRKPFKGRTSLVQFTLVKMMVSIAHHGPCEG